MKPSISPLLVVAYSQRQLDVFLRTHRIPADQVRRVREVRDIEGWATKQPLVLLPSWQETHEADQILAVWHHRGGTVLDVPEHRLLGQAPLCEHDTDGDGDCHLCVRKGGCPWPNQP